jgi:cobalt/nickel transport system ATP-binding protein
MNLELPHDEVVARVDEALDLLAVTHLRDRPTHQLSFGERKRVAIAGAVAMRPCVLALDEPTAGLDPAAVDDTLAALDRLHAAGTTLLVATHDVDLALAWADAAGLLVDGRVFQGDPATLFGDPDLLRRARLRPPWVLRVAAHLHAAGVLPDGAAPRGLDGLLDLVALPTAGRA